MRSSDCLVRKATLTDVENICSLNKQLFVHDQRFDSTLDLTWPDSPEGQAYFRTRASAERGVAFVAHMQSQTVGYLIGSEIPSESYRRSLRLFELENMFVVEEHRHNGIGNALFASFVQWCKSQGAERIKVLAYGANASAIRFYRSAGFADYALSLEFDVSAIDPDPTPKR